jgi:hypothetical protein
MDATTSPSGTGTCAKPACSNPLVLDESLYIDGCGFICRQCEGPLPGWWFEVEPPF